MGCEGCIEGEYLHCARVRESNARAEDKPRIGAERLGATATAISGRRPHLRLGLGCL